MLSSAHQEDALIQRTHELVDEALKPEMTAEEKQAHAKDKVPKGSNKLESGCGGSLLHDDVLTSHTSTTKMDGQKMPVTHPVVQALLDGIRADKEAGRLDRIGNGHGKCAEVVLLSDRLWRFESGGMKITTLEEARSALEGSKIHTHRIGDHIDQDGNIQHRHGDYIPPCETCVHLLRFLDIMVL